MLLFSNYDFLLSWPDPFVKQYKTLLSLVDSRANIRIYSELVSHCGQKLKDLNSLKTLYFAAGFFLVFSK